MNIPLSTHPSSCERHLKTVDCTVTDDFSRLLKLETALPQARSFQPVACPINSAPSPTKFNTSCPPPDPSALSFIKSIIASLQLLATDSHCECELEHSMVMISPFSESYFFSVLGQVDGVCLLRQNDLPEVDGTSACSRCACVHALSPSQQRLIPSRSHRDDGSLWAVEFSDHVQILPWASPSQYSQK